MQHRTQPNASLSQIPATELDVMTIPALPANSIALVTGASSGIGAAIAEQLTLIGCRVICAARRLGKLQSLTDRLGESALALELDVTDPDAVANIGERLPSAWSEIEILVNNAGHDVGGRRLFHEGSAEQWASIIDTNVIGLIRATRALIPGMLQRNRGHVVNIGSVSGMYPYATGTIYAASKFAVHGFSESLRRDYTDTGIRVTEILPGMVQTGFAEARWDDPEQAQAFYADFGECLTPDDIARSVVFAVQQPSNVVISQLVVVPQAQG